MSNEYTPKSNRPNIATGISGIFMRRKAVIFLTLLMINIPAISQEPEQKICYGSYDIYQDRITGGDNDLDQCEHIIGNVSIRKALYLGTYPLRNIKTIEGDLSISFTDEMLTLSNLKNIVTVTGDLDFYSNDVVDLSMFSSLKTVGGTLKLGWYFESRLRTLEGADNLETVGTLHIENANELSSLAGLTAMRELGALAIVDNKNLKNLTGLEAISTIAGSVDVKDNINLESFAGLENLQEVTGNVVIKNNHSLKNLVGLSSLEKVSQKLKIISNDELETTEGLDRIGYVGKLVIDDNGILTNLNEFKNIEAIHHINIMRNGSLENLNGLEGLVNVDGEIQVHNNNKLSSLKGLDSLEHAGRLSLTYNYQLTDISALKNLDSVSKLQLRQNSGLESIEGLTGLIELEDCYIDNHLNLINIAGLSNLQQVTRTLSLRHNPLLQTTDIIDTLTNAGQLLIEGTPHTP